MHSVTVYHAGGCHLCERALTTVRALRAEVPFALTEVDITGDEVLERTYRERIPVVEIDGAEAFTYFVHTDAMRRKLAAQTSD